MMIGNDFAKAYKDGKWFVYNKYTINFEPDFVADTEKECDDWITKKYDYYDKLESEMEVYFGK